MSRSPDPPGPLRPRRLRTLRLATASAAGREPFISAASGLVVAGRWLYVIADDELHLGVFPVAGAARGTLIRLLPGVLPPAPARRKAHKADFEALALLPAFGSCPHGALLAMGSGSRPRRRRAALLPLEATGAVSSPPRVIDLTGLYAGLADRLGEVNVEGAVVLGRDLCLLHRGHPRKGGSALVRVNLAAAVRALDRHGALDELPCRVHRYDLGEADGVPLGFTDGAALPGGGLVFTAVAEHSADSYQDGPCLASAVGQLGPGGGLEWLRRLHPSRKVEGIAVRRAGGRPQLLLVTDADDGRVAAGLYATGC